MILTFIGVVIWLLSYGLLVACFVKQYKEKVDACKKMEKAYENLMQALKDRGVIR